MAEYPPLSLLIFGSHSLWSSCATTFMSYMGGYTSGLTLTFDLPSSGCFRGVDVNPPWGSEAKCTCCGCWHAFHVSSSASSSLNWDLPMTRISWEIPEACAVATPLLAFTVPGSTLNASLYNSFNLFTGGTGTSGTLLCCSWTLSRIACCFSNRVDNCLISLDWDLISLACWRCKCNRTETCVRWAISSSIISARRASWPYGGTHNPLVLLKFSFSSQWNRGVVSWTMTQLSACIMTQN